MTSCLKSIYDALIIGAGPAGLAAATALGRAGRRVAVFDSQEYRNEGVPQMHNVVLHDGQNPALYRSLAIQDISAKYETVSFIDTVIVSARKLPIESFQVTNNRGNDYRGKTLILATGSRDILPDIPGYAELWGNGIVHCLFCDGFERKEMPGGALGVESLQDITHFLMASHLINNTFTIFLNGNNSLSKESQKNLRVAMARGCKVDSRKIRRFSRTTDGICIEFEDNSQADVGFIMHTPPTRNRASSLISMLGIDSAGDGLHIQTTNPVGETNVRGCFAAGDTATPYKAVSVALAAGTMAGIGAAMQLAADEGFHAGHLSLEEETSRI